MYGSIVVIEHILGFYICVRIRTTMADHHEGHFPEEAEENEIGGPVLLALMILGSIVLLIWAAS